MNTMNHGGYTARIEFDERDNVFVGRILGLRVDRIIGELGVSADSVRPAPSLLRIKGAPHEFFTGVCRSGDEMVFVVNLDAMLDPNVGNTASRAGGDE